MKKVMKKESAARKYEVNESKEKIKDDTLKKLTMWRNDKEFCNSWIEFQKCRVYTQSHCALKALMILKLIVSNKATQLGEKVSKELVNSYFLN